MSVKNHFEFGPEDHKVIIETARWVGGTMVFLVAVVTAVMISISQ